MLERDFYRNKLNDKIRVVSLMVEDLDDGLKAHFYKSMLSSTELENNLAGELRQGSPVLAGEIKGFNCSEYKLINDLASSMREIDFLLNFENLLLNP